MNVTLGSIAASAIFSCVILAVGHFVKIEQPATLNQASGANNTLQKITNVNQTSSYIVQSEDIDIMTNKVEAIGGQVVGTYPSLNSINAVLTQTQQQYLEQHTDFVIHDNFIALN